uniref:Laminin EGF-like domain-containing protein n=1 Tax=Anisakis simplex TaxID=6269 RepID=A0A0M3JC11_ANISI
LGYSGDCFCNGHSSTCDLIGHFCVDCADNTDGVQCEQCSAGYSGSALADSLDGCTEMSTNQSSSICTCNRHSSSCDSDGICQDCEHNTTGTKCEHCKSGFYGDATQGTKDDCIKCPCGEGGECFVNSDSLLECRVCNSETPNKMCNTRK